MKHKTAELTGMTFGSLTVRCRSGTSSEGRRLWLCDCACGRQREVSTKGLRQIHACEFCMPVSSHSPLAVRMRNYVVMSSGCWEWAGKRNECGYGCIRVKGRFERAHRIAYFETHPAANRSLVVMHKCDNPPCINPDHLTLGTVRDNVQDMHAKGRFRGGAKAGNTNGRGNKGWQRGGIVKMLGRLAAKLGPEVELP